MPSNPELTEIVEQILTDFPKSAESLADALTAVQEKFNYVPPSTVAAIAEHVELTRPEIYRAIDLSPSLSLTPEGEHKLYVCNADNCCMQGGTELMDFAKQRLGVDVFQTTANKKIRLESFQCLGNCSMSPNVMVDGRVYGMMDEQQMDQLIDNLECGIEPPL